MIAVRVFIPEDYDPETDAYEYFIAGLTQEFPLWMTEELIQTLNYDLDDFSEKQEGRKPRNGEWYEVILRDALEPGDPAPTPTFRITSLERMEWESGHIYSRPITN